jgi:hypothetical protein
VGITYPSDWKQKTGDNFVAAVSKDGQAWSAMALLEGVTDKQAGIEKVKQGLEKHLQDIKYDDETKTQGGALVVTGTGKTKKSGVGVVFAAGVLDAGGGQLAGVAFVVDQNVEQHYKETVRYICQTIHRGQDSEPSNGVVPASATPATARITVRVGALASAPFLGPRKINTSFAVRDAGNGGDSTWRRLRIERCCPSPPRRLRQSTMASAP